MIDEPVRPVSSDEPTATPIRRRPLRSRASAGHVVMVLAGLLTFILVLVALRDRDRTSFVAVAVESIEQGTIVRADSIEFRSVNVEDADLVAGFVDGTEMQAGLDAFVVAARSIPAGAVLLDADLMSDHTGPTGLRAMSLELPPGRAVAGTIDTGDRIDVLEVTDEGTEAVAVAVEVIATVDPSSLGFGGGGATLTIAVDAPTSLRLAHALAFEDVFVVRATGAPHMAPGTTYRVDDA